jgi:hypothetical protein
MHTGVYNDAVGGEWAGQNKSRCRKATYLKAVLACGHVDARNVNQRFELRVGVVAQECHHWNQTFGIDHNLSRQRQRMGLSQIGRPKKQGVINAQDLLDTRRSFVADVSAGDRATHL